MASRAIKVPSAAQAPPQPGPAFVPGSIRARSKVSAVDDPLEREADAMAEQALRWPDPARAGVESDAAQAQGRPAGSDGPPPAIPDRGETGSVPEGLPPIVHEVLSSPGQPLDRQARRELEPRFGHSFARVRTHADGPAAASALALEAHAYTAGQHIVFAAGSYAPDTPHGKRLLAHELAHTIQFQGGAGAGGLVALQTWGTAKTTAPPAKNESPGDVFRAKLKDEAALFANAGAIVDWIVSERAAAGGATVTSFTTAALFSAAATMKKLKPQPAAVADLLPALEMLEFYKVVQRKGPGEWDIVLTPPQPGQTQQEVDRAGFDQKRRDVEVFQKTFEKRFDAQGHPIKQIAQQQLLEDSMAAGATSEFKSQKAAETNLAAVKMELDEFVAFRKQGPPIFRVTTDSPERVTDKGKTNVLLPIAGQKKPLPVDEAQLDRIESIRTGTSPEVAARRKSIEAKVKGAERGLFDAQAFHRFATEMVWFLHELATVSSVTFKAGTYPRHGKFAEYAADMYPTINEDARRFYEPAKAETFVDAINQVAEAGNPYWGKFAWQIVYNDTTLQAKINQKYGPRMSSAEHHGPAPDKLHMHLDIRPLDLVADPDTGFAVNPSGRVVLY